jgi:predicted porin
VTASAIYGLDDTTTQPGHVLSADVSYRNGRFRASAVYSSWRNHAIDVGSKLGYASFLGQSLAGGSIFTARTQRISGLSGLYSLGKRVDLHGMLTQVNLGTDTGSGRMRTVEAGADFRTTAANTVNVGGYLSWLTDTRHAEAGVGDMYQLSVRTTVYAQIAWQHANGAGKAAIPLLVPSSNANQAALRIGMHHFF